jgi:RHS repeat-associated protein
MTITMPRSSDQAMTFAYNPASQIVGRTSSNDSYAFTRAANVARAYAVNGLNQYSAVGPNAYGYDANGNLTSDGISTYAYDAENRLVSSSAGVSLAYDPLGRLWRVSGPSGIRRFEYDGDRLIQEFASDGYLVAMYAHGPGADEPLVWYDIVANAWARRYLRTDHQGSITAIGDDSGNAVHVNAYDPWGIGNSDNVGRFGYTGQAWLSDLGMYYYKARIYSPALGRFLQTDPVGYNGGINLYEYAEDDPLNQSDPSGNNPVAIAVGIRVGIAGVRACAANSLCRSAAIWAAKQIVRGLAPHIFPPVQSTPVPQNEKPGTAGGDRTGKDFTPKGKRQVIEERRQETGGNPRCIDCDHDTNDPKRTEKGDKRDPRERNVDHIVDKKHGGDGSPGNGAVRCFECNIRKPPKGPSQ